jgi:hypothetical protein
MADLNETVSALELYLDEFTGERVSKTELKRRQKQRQKDAEKALKLASRPAPAPKKMNAESEEKELNPNVFNTISKLWVEAADMNCIAIFRNSITEHQQASRISRSLPVPL